MVLKVYRFQKRALTYGQWS